MVAAEWKNERVWVGSGKERLHPTRPDPTQTSLAFTITLRFTNICIFTILFSLYVLLRWQEEFVSQLRATLVGDPFLNSRNLQLLIQGWYCKEKLIACHVTLRVKGFQKNRNTYKFFDTTKQYLLDREFKQCRYFRNNRAFVLTKPRFEVAKQVSPSLPLF